CSLRFRARQGGRPSGRRCCSTPNRRSRARGRFTRARSSVNTWHGKSVAKPLRVSVALWIFLLCASVTLWRIPFAASTHAVPTFDSSRAWEHLRQLVAIGPRPAGSPEIEQARKYIKAQLAAAGVSVAEQAWDDETPLGRTRMANLIATIPGAKKDRLV